MSTGMFQAGFLKQRAGPPSALLINSLKVPMGASDELKCQILQAPCLSFFTWKTQWFVNGSPFFPGSREQIPKS